MDISEIIDFLEDNGLCEAEEIKTDDGVTLIKFYYDFDNDEKNAAKSYADEESDFESESDEWFAEYLPLPCGSGVYHDHGNYGQSTEYLYLLIFHDGKYSTFP